MSADVFLPSEWDRKIKAAGEAYNRAIWRSDLTVADVLWDELQQLRHDRDAFYAQHHRSR